MLGAIIGDIVGSRFEFNNTNRTDFELFTDITQVALQKPTTEYRHKA